MLNHFETTGERVTAMLNNCSNGYFDCQQPFGHCSLLIVEKQGSQVVPVQAGSMQGREGPYLVGLELTLFSTHKGTTPKELVAHRCKLGLNTKH